MTTPQYLSKLEHYIDGNWVKPTSGKTQEVINPAKNKPIGELGFASKGDLDKAMAAVDGFKTWRKVSAFERGKILRKAADLVRARADEIAKVLTLEQGKILAEAKLEVLSARRYHRLVRRRGPQRAYGRIIPARADGVRNMVIMEPIGPVAGFSPWNFPVTQAVRKIAAALAAGCSIIIKCPEETPARRSGWSSASMTPACRRA